MLATLEQVHRVGETAVIGAEDAVDALDQEVLGLLGASSFSAMDDRCGG
ncbi:hypothetical protein [Herbidospora mongoliensis]|nr:hypothetical protein [Herbidospora mongoliensis]